MAEGPSEMGRTGIRAMPAADRPRERLARLGSHVLSDAELLAVLLRTGDGRSRRSALDLAAEMLSRGGGLRFLARATLEELAGFRGIGLAKAVEIKAALELGRRVARDGAQRVRLASPEEAGDFLLEELRWAERETFQVVILDPRCQVLGVETVAVGAADGVAVHPREVFRPAIRRNATAVILAHNHPSGDPAPSADDVGLTRRLVAAGRIIGIDVLDHLIVGDGCFVSMRRLGAGFEGAA